MIPAPTGESVLAYLGWPSDALLRGQADTHALQALALTKAYVRGRGFEVEPDTLMVMVAPEIAGVVTSYAARSLANPTSAREIEAGSFKESPGSAWSFSLIESLILQGWRRMAAG